MCISQVSSNLFPFDSRLPSKVATTALTTTVVAGIILSIAIVFKWGVIAYSTLGVIGGISTIIACAIIVCQQNHDKKEDRTETLEQKRQEMSQSLYSYIEENNIAGFKKALKNYDKDTLYGICTTDSVCTLDGGKRSPATSTETFLLLAHLFRMKDVARRDEFLTATLDTFEDHTFKALSYVYNDLVENEFSDEMKLRILTKFDGSSISTLFNEFFNHLHFTSNMKYFEWVHVLMEEGLKDPFVCKTLAEIEVYETYLVSCLQKADKLDPKVKKVYCQKIKEVYK